MSQTLHLRSSIKPALKKKLLLSGTLVASAGILLMLVSGLALSVETLEVWGLPVLGISLAMITAGLLPYKRLTRLEVQPHELLLTADHEIHFYYNHRPCFTLSWDNIAKTAYVDHPSHYGIALWLKNPDPAILKCYNRKDCDLFFPFFSPNSYQEMVNFIN